MINNDFFFGMLMAIPIYFLIILIFRDTIIKHFISHAILQRIPVENKEINIPVQSIDATEIAEDVMCDILTSYRLLLIIHEQLLYLKDHMVIVSDDNRTIDIYTDKIKEVENAIEVTEQLFKHKNDTRYLDIQKEIPKYKGDSDNE